MSTLAAISDEILAKEADLLQRLRDYGAIAIAYSGGVDSTYLADAAHEALGAKATMILADSPSIPRSEMAAAVDLARARGWNLEIIQTTEFENEAYLRNDTNRCYYCKSELFDRMQAYAQEHGVPVIAYGAIADDLADATRVGHIAAKERRAVAPLQQAGLHKDEIRQLSRRRGLPTWNKASFACLASRVPVGTAVSVQVLSKVEQAEEILRAMGFRQYRARHHGELCRIEVDETDFARLLEPEVRAHLLRELRAAGYRHVTLDLAGYRTGSTAAPPSVVRPS